MDFSGKRVLVFGTGISGIGAARLLKDAGAVPVLFDGNEKLTDKDILARLPDGFDAEIVIGTLSKQLLETIDLVVLSPGVPTDLEIVDRIRSCGIPIWGEVELAWQCSRGDVLAITGTNGKTTTTSLAGEIMRYHLEAGTSPRLDQVHVVGNIGIAYTGVAMQTTKQSVCVAEISSFQLETIHEFHPRVSAITNITPDHLNRHHTMEEYIRVKKLIASNQDERDVCVLNYEDPILREFGEQLRSDETHQSPKVIFFSSGHELEEGFYLEGDRIICRENGERTALVSTREVRLPGKHNYENIMTAAAMTHAWGVPFEEICHVLRVFKAVEHRIEYVAEKGGVVYYNDSKGTNPDAAIRGIQAMDRPTILIGGGYDKDSQYEDWIRAFEGKVRYLVLVGQTREKIAQAAKRCGFNNIIMAETFEEAFSISTEKARPGDAVLLSPACASWGMFPNYEVRGKIFKALVNQLPD